MKDNTRKIITNSGQAASIILGLDSPTILWVIRSLGKQRVPVIGITDNRYSLSAFSKYCRVIEIVKSEENLINLLLEIGSAALYRPVIFVENDKDLLFIEHYQNELSKYFLWLPSLNCLLSEIINKGSMLAVAKEADLDIPTTFFSGQHSFETIQSSVVFPCIVKPLFTQNDYKTKCELAENREQLYQIIKERRFNSGYMVQEIISGPVENLVFYIGYFNKRSKPLSSVTGYKFRQLPYDFGIGTIAVSRLNQKIKQISEKFLTHIGFHGLADIEFKYDPKTNRYIFIEINLRPCGLIELATSAGLDMAYLAYIDLTTDLYRKETIDQKDGVFWMSILMNS